MKRAAFFFLLLAASGCGRKTYLASVNGTAISADDFRSRYKEYLSATGVKDNMKLRQQVVNNMVNEVLILDQVRRKGVLDDSAGLKRVRELRNQALLTVYAQRISLDTMIISEEDIQREFARYNTKLNVRYLYAPTEEGAWGLKDSLERGATFERLARSVFEDPGLASNGGSLGTVGWGEMEDAFQNAAYALPVGAVSDPVKIRIGYAIIRVDSRIVNPLASESDFANVEDKLSGAVQKKRLAEILSGSAMKIEKDLAVEFNEETLRRLAGALLPRQGALETGAAVEARLNDLSGLKLASFRGEWWTVADFEKKMGELTDRQRRRLRTERDLREFIVGVAVRDVTLGRARAAGLESDTSVVQQTDRTVREYALERWRSAVVDTVGRNGWSEDVLRKYFDEHHDEYVEEPRVNVGEILVRTWDEGDKIRRRISAGADFASLAREKSMRAWAAKNGGELGYLPKSGYGTLADTFFASQVGKLLGPLFVDPYFGVFRILGKIPARAMTFAESRSRVAQELESDKKRDAFKSAVDQLQQGADVSVNTDLLAKIDLN
jgi:parvulin-like peptidyl-prolyl isomerase